MRTFCIYCPELPERREQAGLRFAGSKVPVEWICAIHGETFGILCSRPYRLDRPHEGCLIPIAHVGLVLSHYMAWTVCSHLPEDHFMILEDDAKFLPDWEKLVNVAMQDAPADWDILMIGSSNTFDKPRTQVKESIWTVEWPFCTHAYIVRKKALPHLLSNCRDCSMKIDTLLIKKAYPFLKTYTVLPRIVSQEGTDLTP